MKDDLHKELADSAFLSKMKGQKQGFELPDNYFQHLQVDMMQRVREEDALAKSEAPRKLGFWQGFEIPKFAWGMMVTAVVAIAIVAFLPTQAANTATAWEEVSDEELYNYLNRNLESIDLEALASLSEETELEFLTEGIESDQLDAYLEGIIDEMDADEFDNLF